MCAYQLYPSEERFWEDFSTLNGEGQIVPMTWGQVLKKAREIRETREKADAQKAREEYVGKEFTKEFLIRKVLL